MSPMRTAYIQQYSCLVYYISIYTVSSNMCVHGYMCLCLHVCDRDRGERGREGGREGGGERKGVCVCEGTVAS